MSHPVDMVHYKYLCSSHLMTSRRPSVCYLVVHDHSLDTGINANCGHINVHRTGPVKLNKQGGNPAPISVGMGDCPQ